MSVTTLKIQCNRGGTDFWLPYWSRNTCNNKNVCPVKILQENFEHCANGINTILFSLMCLTRKFTSPSYFPVLMYTCFIKTWAPLISFQYFFPKIKKRTKHLPSLFWKKKITPVSYLLLKYHRHVTFLVVRSCYDLCIKHP